MSPQVVGSPPTSRLVADRDRGSENLVGVLPAGYWTPLADHPLPALLLTALASLAGMLLVLLGSLVVYQFSQLLPAVR